MYAYIHTQHTVRSKDALRTIVSFVSDIERETIEYKLGNSWLKRTTHFTDNKDSFGWFHVEDKYTIISRLHEKHCIKWLKTGRKKHGSLKQTSQESLLVATVCAATVVQIIISLPHVQNLKSIGWCPCWLTNGDADTDWLSSGGSKREVLAVTFISSSRFTSRILSCMHAWITSTQRTIT